MFTVEQVKKFILHPEPLVSNAALRYFEDSYLYENDTSLMPLVLKRLQQTNEPERYHWFYAEQFPQTEETVRELVDYIQTNNVDVNVRFQLLNILGHCDDQLLENYHHFVEKNQTLQKRVEDKRRIVNMEDQDLITTFETFLKDCYGKYVNEIDTSYGKQLVHELSRRRCIPPETILEKLDLLDKDGYGVIYYTQLAGAMKLEAAIPMLTEFLGEDADLLPEMAQNALVRIGTSEVVSSVMDRYHSAPEEYYRLFASELFGRIKLPVSEQAIKALLPKEDDPTNATFLADGLCSLGSTDSVRFVEHVLENGYDRRHLDLEESLYVYCVISNTDHPELQKWKKQIEEKLERQSKLSEFLDGPSSEKNLESLLSLWSKENSNPFLNKKKVGRNDPCPCGSGKKYKKCCLQRQ